MKINELRVGNWYYSVKFNIPVKCELSDLYELCVRSDGAYNDPPIDEMFKPIIITERWLTKLGLKKLKGCLVGYGIAYGPHDINFLNRELYCYLNNYRLSNIQYVHQIQDLCAVLEEDLSVK